MDEPLISRLWSRALALRAEAQRFVLAGIVSFGLGLALSAVLREGIHLREEVAVAIALGVLFLTNFWMSRRMVFRSSGAVPRQIMMFGVTSLTMRGVEYGLFLVLSTVGLHYLVALALGMAISSLAKFFIYRTLVFVR